MSERDYINGNRMAWRVMLGECIRALLVNGDRDAELDAARAVAELEDARAALRRVCEDHGDNDWDDDLHLADVIEKHLARHLDEAVENESEEPR